MVNIFAQAKAQEPLQRSLDDVRRVLGTERFGQDVFHAG